MIKYISHNNVDKKRWDNCISQSPQALVYAFSWYLDIVSPGWQALIEDDYSSVFPLTFRKKAGINYLYQPYFTQQLGVFTNGEITKNKIEEFLKAIPEKFKLIEIQLNHANLVPEDLGYNIENRLTHHLPLDQKIENIRSNYSENLKRNIKKWQKSSTNISTEISTEEIISLFRNNRGAAISNLSTNNYNTFLSLCLELKKRELLFIRGIRNTENSLIAGAIFIKSPHSFIFIFSATSPEAKENGSMSALIDSFIEEHYNENNYLDFEGSMDANLARFYKSFGSKEVVYLQIRRNNLPLILRWLK